MVVIIFATDGHVGDGVLTFMVVMACVTYGCVLLTVMACVLLTVIMVMVHVTYGYVSECVCYLC